MRNGRLALSFEKNCDGVGNSLVEDGGGRIGVC
jgi:hypothetical protein